MHKEWWEESFGVWRFFIFLHHKQVRILRQNVIIIKHKHIFILDVMFSNNLICIFLPFFFFCLILTRINSWNGMIRKAKLIQIWITLNSVQMKTVEVRVVNLWMKKRRFLPTTFCRSIYCTERSVTATTSRQENIYV